MPSDGRIRSSKSITAMANQRLIEGEDVVGLISWTADVHVYPTGASLEDDLPANWARRGQVHVMIVHSGRIVYYNPRRLGEFTLWTKIKNDGAMAKVLLPATDSGVDDDDKTHCAAHRFNLIVPLRTRSPIILR